MSYSLYFFYFPIVVALADFLVPPERRPPWPEAFAVFVVFVATALPIAALFLFVFERNTARLYTNVMAWLSTNKATTRRALEMSDKKPFGSASDGSNISLRIRR